LRGNRQRLRPRVASRKARYETRNRARREGYEGVRGVF
jgi:hypothetical protein